MSSLSKGKSPAAGAMAPGSGFQFAAKAGMEQVDRRKVEEVVREATRNSRFKHLEDHRAHLAKARETQWKERRDQFAQQSELAHARMVKEVDAAVEKLEQTRDMQKIWIHIDLDMFYAAVECRDRPELLDVPMAVGSTGMLSTSNYKAREFGVRAAMPGFIAKKLCPELVIVKPRHARYSAVSREIMAILREYDPNLMPMSLDEAYLNLSHVGWQRIEAVVAEMRDKIHQATQLTASAGIACNRLVAKICSDRNKPNGQCIIRPCAEELITFIRDLPTRKIPGIGRATETLLNSGGIATVQGLWDNRYLIYGTMPERTFRFFLRISLGIGDTAGFSVPAFGAVNDDDDGVSAVADGDSEIPPGGKSKKRRYQRKSVSAERTFRATSDITTLMELAEKLSIRLCGELKEEELEARTVSIKYKSINFEIKQKSETLATFSSCKEDLLPPLLKLMQSIFPLPLPLRLLGVRYSSIRSCSAAAGPTMNAGTSAASGMATITTFFDRSKSLADDDDDDRHADGSNDIAANAKLSGECLSPRTRAVPETPDIGVCDDARRDSAEEPIDCTLTLDNSKDDAGRARLSMSVNDDIECSPVVSDEFVHRAQQKVTSASHCSREEIESTSPEYLLDVGDDDYDRNEYSDSLSDGDEFGDDLDTDDYGSQLLSLGEAHRDRIGGIAPEESANPIRSSLEDGVELSPILSVSSVGQNLALLANLRGCNATAASINNHTASSDSVEELPPSYESPHAQQEPGPSIRDLLQRSDASNLPPTSRSSRDIERVQCPVCFRSFHMDNVAFNKHLDLCLNYTETPVDAFLRQGRMQNALGTAPKPTAKSPGVSPSRPAPSVLSKKRPQPPTTATPSKKAAKTAQQSSRRVMEKFLSRSASSSRKREG